MYWQSGGADEFLANIIVNSEEYINIRVKEERGKRRYNNRKTSLYDE